MKDITRALRFLLLVLAVIVPTTMSAEEPDAYFWAGCDQVSTSTFQYNSTSWTHWVEVRWKCEGVTYVVTTATTYNDFGVEVGRTQTTCKIGTMYRCQDTTGASSDPYAAPVWRELDSGEVDNELPPSEPIYGRITPVPAFKPCMEEQLAARSPSLSHRYDDRWS